MSWAGLANNQTVSFNNLQDAVNNSVFVAKTTIPSSNEQITKADANTYVYVDTTYSPYSAKSSNQLVVKSNLISGLYAITWSTTDNGSGTGMYFEISVNGTAVVSVSSNSSGTIYVTPGSYISTLITSTSASPLTAEANLVVVDNSVVLYSNTVTNSSTAVASYGPYYPSGNGSITGGANQY